MRLTAYVRMHRAVYTHTDRSLVRSSPRHTGARLRAELTRRVQVGVLRAARFLQREQPRSARAVRRPVHLAALRPSSSRGEGELAAGRHDERLVASL